MFKTRKQKGRLKKIAIVMFAWFMASFLVGPMNSAFAAEAKVDGKCPVGTVELASASDSEKPCESSEGLKQCGGTELYYPEGADERAVCPSADNSGTSGESLTAQEALQKFTALILSIEHMLNKLLWPILFLIGGLLNNDILFGSGMEERLYDIWVPVRNIVNIIFVIALVGLALYSVLGVNSENSQYSVKTMLPKLIAGIIAVNFSFIAVKVFLDAVNVFTTSIFAIPSQITQIKAPLVAPSSSDSGQTGESTYMPDQKTTEAFCKQVYSVILEKGTVTDDNFNKSIENTAYTLVAKKYGLPTNNIETTKAYASRLTTEKKRLFDEEVESAEEGKLCQFADNTLGLSDQGKAFFARYNSSNAALAMAINMGEIMFYKDVSTGSMGSGTLESLAVNVLFSTLLYVVYGVSFGVLFVVLLARLVVMWIGLALSPIIALSIAVPIAKEKFKLGDLTQKFVAHAIAPIIIAMVMTIGWVMLNAIKSTMDINTGSVGSKGVLVPALPIPGLETLQGLLISLATVAVVWIGVFMAADGTIAGGITKGLQGQLQKFGSFLATAPIKYTPWVPVESKEGGGETVTPDALLHTMGQLEYKLQGKGREKAAQIFGTKNILTPQDINPSTSKESLTSILANDQFDFTKKANYERVKDAKDAIRALSISTNDKDRTLAEEINKALIDPTRWENNAKDIRAKAKAAAKQQEEQKGESTPAEESKKTADAATAKAITTAAEDPSVANIKAVIVANPGKKDGEIKKLLEAEIDKKYPVAKNETENKIKKATLGSNFEAAKAQVANPATVAAPATAAPATAVPATAAPAAVAAPAAEPPAEPPAPPAQTSV